MGYISIAILIITILCLGFGVLLGFLRGRNRSLLRVGLILASAAAAFFLKDVVVNTIMNINIQEQTIRDILINALNNDAGFPASLQTIAMTLVEIIGGIVVFLFVFGVLNFATWAIVFPICKIFVKRESVIHSWQGILIGLVQGILIAFIICVPLNGIIINASQIASLQYQNKPLINIPDEIGLNSYVESTTATIYSFTGNWFYNALSTKEDVNGNKVSISDTCDIAETVVGVADVMTNITNEMQNIDMNVATPQEKVDVMKKLGDNLIELGSSVDELSDDAKTIVKEVLNDAKEMFVDDEGNVPEEVSNLIDNINIDDLKLDSAGIALNGIATYIEKTSDEIDNNEPVTQSDVDNIVNGLADNDFIIDMLIEDGSVTVIDVPESDRAMFKTAIANSSLSNEYKDKMNQMFGLN